MRFQNGLDKTLVSQQSELRLAFIQAAGHASYRRAPFEAFLADPQVWQGPWLRPQVHRIVAHTKEPDGQEIWPSRIVYFERLSEDWDELASHIDLSCGLLRENTTKKAAKPFSSEAKEAVWQRMYPDFQQLGYSIDAV